MYFVGIQQTKYNGRKRPQINKHEIWFLFSFFSPPLAAILLAIHFYVRVFALPLKWGYCCRSGFMNKYEKISRKHPRGWGGDGRKICFHIFGFDRDRN